MNDLTTEGAVAPADDNALFASVTTGSELPSDPPAAQAPQAAPPAPAPAATEPAIPPGRLREETERARAAERERDELRGRLAALERMQQPRQAAQPQTPKADPVDRVLNNPTELIREEFQQQFNPHLQSMHFNNRLIAESVRGGKAAVDEATTEYDRLESSGQLTPAEIQEVRHSPNPFVAAVDLIARRKVLSEVGTDLTAYEKRVREKAMQDPEFQKLVLAATRQAAQQNGQVVNRPAAPPAPPSLNRIGAAALPDHLEEVSDEDLFASTTRRRRAAPG